jgi:hypothetical protein
MGGQHGKLLRPQVQALQRDYLNKLLLPGGRRIGLRASVLKLAREMEKSIPRTYVAEMKALARGAGAEYEDVLLANTVFDIKRALFCTSVVAVGDRSADGKPVFARNLDYPTLGVAHRYSCVIVYHPDEGHAVAAVTFPGLVGVLSGLNDAGVAAAVMEVHIRGSQARATPYAMVFRQALTEGATTEKVVDAVRAVGRSAPNNLMVCDAAGRAACLELGIKKTALRRPENGVIHATNHFRSKELGGGWVCWRTPRIRKALVDGRRMDEERAKQILADVSYKRLTMQSMVFRPASREVLLAIGKPPTAQRPFVRLDGSVLFPSKTKKH